jgi:ribonuclease HI
LLKTATELYIREQNADSLVVFTDRSKCANGQLGIGVVVPSWNTKSNFSVTADVSIFTAELVAILKALEIISQRPPQRATIFTDSHIC